MSLFLQRNTEKWGMQFALTYEDLLFMQVCSDPRSINCNSGFGRMHFSLFSAAVQNRLPAGVCPCKCTYEDLLYIQM